MPILDPEGEDEVFWWRSRNGHYSVRSAYFGAMNDLIDNSHLRIQGAWMSIWRLKIPQKIKLLLWRVARGCLPTRSNLIRRHVPCEDSCPMCGDGVEDDLHVFFKCPQVEAIWQTAGLLNEVNSAIGTNNNFTAVLFNLLEVLPEKNKFNLAMMFWVIWKRRNEKLWEGVSKPIVVAVQNATDFLLQWQQVHGSGAVLRTTATVSAASTNTVNNNQVLSWIRPNAGYLKCNIDGAIFAEENKYGIGICVRDDRDLYRGA